ncbi:hypothetical protein P3T76_001923 [Phytophthora citrophthora]|uniref:Uncharacterized protein n=1 Tax=Phytophthora citrophthora TaxID=4793 RepID=A0AAD9LJ25_9STRA|nr:hypothetical protein P3T76_015834 [Phytophthora citrophthora]KAK1928842.1 hypothetical protein P3T76_015631 [Phytophthora citrophthora]KAK1929289.1 hypothetical protein P3T76_015241 [Phytophthora citrophthora]KAK1929543.1 hypothetical protein P3T76_014941 [Phytophthora citrophthora]KAK1929559.1 hypothetical protein P3T76_014957 [Phytophthora citrophthora]
MGRYKPNHNKSRKRKSRELNLTDSSKPPVVKVVRRAPLPDTSLFDYPYDAEKFSKLQQDLLKHLKKSRRITCRFKKLTNRIEDDAVAERVKGLLNEVFVELGHLEDITTIKLDREVSSSRN